MKKKLEAVCGLDCKQCGAYIALQNDDNKLRIKTAQEWTARFRHNFLPKDINCVGCCTKDGIHSGYCHACPLRSCALNKNISNCYVCPEFQGCPTVKEFETHAEIRVVDNFANEE